MFMRPFGVSGKPPPLISFHERPPSVVFHSAEPGPPLLRKYGPRERSHDAAYKVFGSRGSIATSMKPALSLMNFESSHVFPPSVVLYKPRSAFGPHVAPTAATYTMFGFVGWTTIRPTCCVFSSPTDCQVRPPSADL